jgi:hypothetical protein
MQRFPTFHRNISSRGKDTPTAQDHLSGILCDKTYDPPIPATTKAITTTASKGTTSVQSDETGYQQSPEKMPSSKGIPTDPELREKVKEEVKAEEKGKKIEMIQLYLSSSDSLRRMALPKIKVFADDFCCFFTDRWRQGQLVSLESGRDGS